MHPLRITIVQGAFLPVPALLGGAVEKVWYALGQEFARAGHEVVHIGRSHPKLPSENVSDGVRYIRVRGYDTPRSLWRLKLLDLIYSLRVRRVLPVADILVTNTFWLPIVEQRSSRGRPYVHVARYPKGQMKLYPRRAVLQTVSEPIREAILQEVPGAGSRVRVVPYPLAPHYLTERSEPRNVILYTGRIHPEKGIHLLIGAFLQLIEKGLQGWSLRIIGPWKTEQGGGGSVYRDQLRSAAERGGAAVELLEPIFDEAMLVQQYREAAIFAYPSLAERGETFGLAALEAMAAGCVPVVSALGCFSDFIHDGANGKVFNHRSPDPVAELTRSLSELVSFPERRAELQRAAWETARSYTLPKIANDLILDFCSLVQPPPPLAASVLA
jgi:glycosyltransferase involved in cell wall biosynthesis